MGSRVHQFDRLLVIDFLDYIVFDKERSATTRNNYRTWLSTFATWLVDRQYITENFVESIKMMKETEKFRDSIKPEDLRRLKEYTKEKRPAFYLACLMEYYTFIRPEELRHIKIGGEERQGAGGSTQRHITEGDDRAGRVQPPIARLSLWQAYTAWQ